MKGISPLVASVLLIVMVVTIAALITTWLTTFTKTSQQSVTNKTDTTLDCSGASISIQDVYVTNGSLGTVRALVKNDGLTDGLSIISGQLLNSSGGNFTATNLPFTGFNVGGLATIVFANASIATCSSFSQVIVTSSCGGIFDVFSSPPRSARCVS
jgi:flagellin-like protein